MSMQLTQSLRRIHQVAANATATLDGDRTRTWTQVLDRVTRAAGGLRALGVKPGDRVAAMALNSDRYFEYYLSTPWAGGVVVPVNSRWAVPEIVYSLDDAGAGVLIVDDQFLPYVEGIRAATNTVHTFIYMGDNDCPDGMVALEDLIRDSAPVDDAGRGHEDLYGIFYTGGTTGFPKGVMLSHENIFLNSVATVAEFSYTEDSRYLHAAPMFHLADGAMSFATMMAGGSHVFIPMFNPTRVMETVEKHSVNRGLLVPTMVKMLLDAPDFDPEKLRSLQNIYYGASPMPEAIIRRAAESLPWVRFFQAYGQTELSPCCTVLKPDYHTFDGPMAGKIRSAGRPMMNVEVKIADPDDNEVARGEVGQVLVRGRTVMQGYWNKPEETSAALKGGWMHTGDAAYMDDDGFVFIVDRVKDMIISGGENVYSAEVENAVMQFPAVAECAVIGVPDDKWGERVHAIVVPRPGMSIDPDALVEHCHKLIAGYKCPRSVAVRDEALPLSGAGKILKTDLRKPYWEGASRGVN